MSMRAIDTRIRSVATGEELVTWTTSQQRAMKALHDAGEELETGSTAKAWGCIMRALVHIMDLQRFLKANPHAGRKP